MQMLTSSQPRSCLLPNVLAFTDGVGPEIHLGTDAGHLLVLTLTIDRVVEREALVISVYGATTRDNWMKTPLLVLHERSYCGVYSALLNLSKFPEVQYLRVHWSMRSLDRRQTPLFEFSVSVERSGARVRSAVA